LREKLDAEPAPAVAAVRLGGCHGLGDLGSPPLELIPFEMGGSVDLAFSEMDCDANWKFPPTGSVRAFRLVTSLKGWTQLPLLLDR
jgi:hypothetical protein